MFGWTCLAITWQQLGVAVDKRLRVRKGLSNAQNSAICADALDSFIAADVQRVARSKVTADTVGEPGLILGLRLGLRDDITARIHDVRPVDELALHLGGNQEPSQVVAEDTGCVNQLARQSRNCHLVVQTSSSWIKDESPHQSACLVKAKAESLTDPEKRLSRQDVSDVIMSDSSVPNQLTILNPEMVALVRIKQ